MNTVTEIIKSAQTIAQGHLGITEYVGKLVDKGSLSPEDGYRIVNLSGKVMCHTLLYNKEEVRKYGSELQKLIDRLNEENGTDL